MAEPAVPMPVVSGVYFLFKDRALTYTGKSRNVYGRINEHRVNGRQFDYAMVAACPEQDAGWIEAALIKSYRPPENRSQKPQEGARPVRAPQLPPVPPKPSSDVLPADPDMFVSMVRAQAYANHFGVASSVKPALISGNLPSRRSTRGKGAYQIRVRDLQAWCKRLAN